jgi:flagellar biogenesis protein FliO
MHLVVDQGWLVTADLVLLFIYLIVWLVKWLLSLVGRAPKQ